MGGSPHVAEASGRCVTDEEISAYLDGRLPSGELAILETHLDDCQGCHRLIVEVASAMHSARHVERDTPRCIFGAGQLIAGRYEILDFLGSGGMGEVYQARDRLLGDQVALKTVRAAAAFDDGAIERLKVEMQLARRVTHRNVCRVFDFGIHAD